MKGIGGNGYNIFKQLRLLNGPLNQLLAAHAATYADKYFVNMQVRFKVLVTPYHIPGGKQRKVVVKWLVGYRVCVQRAYASVATARHVHTHNKILGRVEHGILANEAWPPFNRVTVGGKGMEYPNHIVFVFVKLAICGISQMKTFYSAPTFKCKEVIVSKCFVRQENLLV